MIKVTLANGQTRTFDDAIGYKVSDGMLRVLREFEGDTPEGFLKRGEKTIATFSPGWVSVETVEDKDLRLIESDEKSELGKAISAAITQLHWSVGDNWETRRHVGEEQQLVANRLHNVAVELGIIHPFPTR